MSLHIMFKCIFLHLNTRFTNIMRLSIFCLPRGVGGRPNWIWKVTFFKSKSPPWWQPCLSKSPPYSLFGWSNPHLGQIKSPPGADKIPTWGRLNPHLRQIKSPPEADQIPTWGSLNPELRQIKSPPGADQIPTGGRSNPHLGQIKSPPGTDQIPTWGRSNPHLGLIKSPPGTD